MISSRRAPLLVTALFLFSPCVALAASFQSNVPLVSAPMAGIFGGLPSLDSGQPGGSGMETYGIHQAPSLNQAQIENSLGMSITRNKAIEIINSYLAKTRNDDLYIQVIYEYNTHYEVELKEMETHRGAFELLVDKFNGRVFPEPGPNLVWNGKYGVNANYFGVQSPMSITVNEALKLVGEFVRRTSPGMRVQGDVSDYYGYYEFHVTMEDTLVLEINVNGFNGQIWVENWHGPLLSEFNPIIKARQPSP
jgi:hypothetical protein